MAVTVQDAERGQPVEEDADADGDQQDAEQPGEHLEDALVHAPQGRREYPGEEHVHQRD